MGEGKRKREREDKKWVREREREIEENKWVRDRERSVSKWVRGRERQSKEKVVKGKRGREQVGEI